MISAPDNPYRSPLRWDYIEAAGIISPGVIPHGGISGFDRRYSFDPKNGYGMYGSILTFAMRPAATGTIRIWTWTAEQYDSMPTFLNVLEYDPTKTKVQAIEIGHPSLAALGLRRFVTTGISPPRHLGGKKYEWSISLIEFRAVPQISAVSTPITTKKKEDDFESPTEKHLDAMVADSSRRRVDAYSDADAQIASAP